MFYVLFRSKKRQDEPAPEERYDEEDQTGPQGFTRDMASFGANDHDGAEVDDELVDDNEEMKSEEPDDGEDLDERIDE